MLKPLTSFRFIAALLVFMWHAPLLRPIVADYQFGYAGVSFFFLLSGFILAYTYHEKLSEPNRAKLRSFYSARIAKILPVHLLTLALAILLLVLTGITTGVLPHPAHWKVGLLMNALLLQSYFPDNSVNFSYNGVAWSISDEALFYALFPLLIWGLLRLRGCVSLRTFGMGMVAFWLALVAFDQSQHAIIDQWSIYIFPPARVLDFAMGISLGIIFLEHPRLPKWLNPKWSTSLEVGVIALLVAAIAYLPHIPQSLRFNAFLMPFWCLLIFVFAAQSGRFTQALSWRPLTYLGEISFSFYMIHQLVIRYMGVLGFSKLTITIAGLIVALGMSALIFETYEEPLRVRIKGLLLRPRMPKEKTRNALPQGESTALPA